jgi:glycosyltransferase involved in cell wall biosynthesis
MPSRSVIEVDVLIPVHNATDTLRATIESAMNQEPSHDDDNVENQIDLDVHICCYDDGSTDTSWSILKDLEDQHMKNSRQCSSICCDGSKRSRVLTKLWLGKEATSRGAGYARNRAAQLRPNPNPDGFLCWLDSDDLMAPTRIYRQVQYLLSLEEEARKRALLGCTFERDPPDSTWHYSAWANGLTDDRLSLERFRELTIIQPSWMMQRSRFAEVGGYVEAPPLNDSDDSVECSVSIQKFELIHPVFDTPTTLRLAEDLRFFHAHLHSNGTLNLLRHDPPLVIYRHRAGLSQSTTTPRKLLLQLRTLAFERMVLESGEIWKENGFCIWGAGRDGKDFVKALSDTNRKRIRCMVDVDDRKIAIGSYVNRDIRVNIPIMHFSLLAKDESLRSSLYEQWTTGQNHNLPGFGKIRKGRNLTGPQGLPSAKKPKLSNKGSVDPQFKSLLRELPVVVCVSMYRTNGALEHNVKQIGRIEGEDLWHFI